MTYIDGNHARMVVWQCLVALGRMTCKPASDEYRRLLSRKYHARKWLKARNLPGGESCRDIDCGIRGPNGKPAPLPPTPQ